MFRAAVWLLLVFAPSIASAAGEDLASVSRYDRAVMIVMPEPDGADDLVVANAEDCGTQRWLSRDGVRMAEAIGDTIRAAGFEDAPVYSSESCAAREAATLFKLGNKGALSFLNDIATTPVSRTKQRQALGLFMADYQGEPTMVFVTHRNNLIDISGLYPDYGDAIVIRVNLARFEPVFLRQVSVK